MTAPTTRGGNRPATPRPRILVLESGDSVSRCIRRAGALTTTVSPYEDKRVDALLKAGNIDGIALSGGGDVDPRLYGQKAHRKVYGVSEVRDLVEMVVLEYAEHYGLPVFGICRGSQIQNVEAGGTLVQDIKGHQHNWHAVGTRPGSLAQRVMGERCWVMSLHHQCIDIPAPGWQVSAYAADGTPEAVERLDGRCLAVQFHPEMDASEHYAHALFRWLVVEAAVRAEMTAPPEQSPATATAKSTKGKARQRRKENRKRNSPTTVTWYCPSCSAGTVPMRFTDPTDYVDHMRLLHGTEVQLNQKAAGS